MHLNDATAKLLCVALWILMLAGCGTEAIKVSDGALVDQVDYQWLNSDRSRARVRFTPDDEKVTLSVHFNYNLRAAFEWYRVEWIDPNGKPYKVVSTRTEFGSHQDLQAAIKIRGKMAARLPGLWRVRLYHLNEDGSKDSLLFSRLFRITAAGEPETITTARRKSTAQPPVTLSATQAAAVASTTHLSTPLPAETGVSEVRLTVEHSGPEKSLTPRPGSKQRYPGCPPLYYPPDEGCIEEAPEE